MLYSDHNVHPLKTLDTPLNDAAVAPLQRFLVLGRVGLYGVHARELGRETIARCAAVAARALNRP